MGENEEYLLQDTADGCRLYIEKRNDKTASIIKVLMDLGKKKKDLKLLNIIQRALL